MPQFASDLLAAMMDNMSLIGSNTACVGEIGLTREIHGLIERINCAGDLTCAGDLQASKIKLYCNIQEAYRDSDR